MAGRDTTVQLSSSDMTFLKLRGARSHRGGGAFSNAEALRRALQMLRTSIEHSDPRSTRGLSVAGCEVVIERLPSPWTLKTFEIERLADFLRGVTGLAAALADAQVDPEEFLEQVAALSFAERMWLVDAALCHQGPAASARESDE